MDEKRRPRAHGYGEGPEAIRRAAVEIALEQGLGKVTLRGVAERAGVSHGLVRHHFGSREGLSAEVIREIVGRTLYLADGPAPLSRRIDDTVGELRVQYELMLSREHADDVDAMAQRYREEVTQWLAGRGAAASDPLVTLVVAVLDGLALQRLARGSAVDVDAAMSVFEQLIKT